MSTEKRPLQSTGRAIEETNKKRKLDHISNVQNEDGVLEIHQEDGVYVPSVSINDDDPIKNTAGGIIEYGSMLANSLSELTTETADGKHRSTCELSPKILKKVAKSEMVSRERSIPSMVDGLKLCQRQILFCAFEKLKLEDVVNVADFCRDAFLQSAYHHREGSLIRSLLGMALNCVGSNNINLLYAKGKFGIPLLGVEDNARGDYIHTWLSPVSRHVCHEADELIPNFLNEDGEPTWYIPIIPMVLVNGCEGRGTFVPNFNPQEIIANIKRLLKGEEMVPMDPWYKGFKGTIKKTSSSEYTTTGALLKEKEDDNAFIITQLPVKMWTREYRNFLYTAPFIKEHNVFGDFPGVVFEVKMSETQMNKAKKVGLLKKLKLTTTLSTSRMYLLDENGAIKKYETPEQILEDFFYLRLRYYKKRKVALLFELEKALINLLKKLKLCKKMKFEHTKSILIAALAGTNLESVEFDDLMSVETVDEVQLEKDLAAKKAEMVELRKTSSKSLWIRDLDALVAKLKEQDEKDQKRVEMFKELKEKANHFSWKELV